MLTFTDQTNMAIAISNLSDVTSVMNFKRDINAGTARVLAKLGRPVDRQSRFTSSVIGQQYYQLPEDGIRVSYIIFQTGSNIWTPLEEVGDESTWRRMNMTPQTSQMPSHFFVKGFDEFGIYPTPSIAATNNIELVFEPKHVLLTANDYTTGSVTVQNGSNAIVGSGTVFTSTMANGSYVLQVTDGTDGNYYKITGYTDQTHLTVENFYQGITGTPASYRIGQVSKIPEEFQEVPVDYAMYRHFLEKGEMKDSQMFQALWMSNLKDLEDVYGMSTSNQIVKSSDNLGGNRFFNPLLDSTFNQINV